MMMLDAIGASPPALLTDERRLAGRPLPRAANAPPPPISSSLESATDERSCRKPPASALDKIQQELLETRRREEELRNLRKQIFRYWDQLFGTSCLGPAV